MRINDKLAEKYPWGKGREWPVRAGVIASAIPHGASVLELGGGFCGLAAKVPGSKYRSIDLEKWTSLTVVGDLNANSADWPAVGKFDVLVAQGIIEYMDYVGEFLNGILTRYGRARSVLIASYRIGKPDGKRRNFMSFVELKITMAAAGWDMVFEKAISPGEKIFYCSRI